MEEGSETTESLAECDAVPSELVATAVNVPASSATTRWIRRACVDASEDNIS